MSRRRGADPVTHSIISRKRLRNNRDRFAVARGFARKLKRRRGSSQLPFRQEQLVDLVRRDSAGGVPAVHDGIDFLSGGYSDSIGPQTSSTRSVNRSPISRSVTSP